MLFILCLSYVIRYDAIITKNKKKYGNYFRVIATSKTDLKNIELLY